jgi:hypothetical protein
MQVFGLPGHIIRCGKLASRIAAKSPSNEAAIRGATVARWRLAMADGLTAERPPRRRACHARHSTAGKYMAQLQHNMWVTHLRTSMLSIITGGGKWVEIAHGGAREALKIGCSEL